MVEKAKVLITGSSGMLGLSLCKTLAEKYEIFGLDTLNSQIPTLESRFFIQCDITDKDKVVTSINRIKPYIIVHTAAYTDVDGCELNPDKAFAVNFKGTENIAHAAKEVDAALFYISTDYVFDGSKDKPYIETDAPNPINIYGKSKLEGEKSIQSLLVKYFILRTSWLFGPEGKNFVTTILQRAKENKTLQVVNDQFGSPTYTLDLAKAIKDLLQTPNSKSFDKLRTLRRRTLSTVEVLPTNFGIYHITNSSSCSWYEFAKEIIKLKQISVRVEPINSSESKRPAQRPKMSILDNRKLFTVFGLKLRPWQEAVGDFLGRLC